MANKYVRGATVLYPCEVPFEAVDVQLGPLGVHVGADGEEVLRQRQEINKKKNIKNFIYAFMLVSFRSVLGYLMLFSPFSYLFK